MCYLVVYVGMVGCNAEAYTLKLYKNVSGIKQPHQLYIHTVLGLFKYHLAANYPLY